MRRGGMFDGVVDLGVTEAESFSSRRPFVLVVVAFDAILLTLLLRVLDAVLSIVSLRQKAGRDVSTGVDTSDHAILSALDALGRCGSCNLLSRRFLSTITSCKRICVARRSSRTCNVSCSALSSWRPKAAERDASVLTSVLDRMSESLRRCFVSYCPEEGDSGGRFSDA